MQAQHLCSRYPVGLPPEFQDVNKRLADIDHIETKAQQRKDPRQFEKI